MFYGAHVETRGQLVEEVSSLFWDPREKSQVISLGGISLAPFCFEGRDFTLLIQASVKLVADPLGSDSQYWDHSRYTKQFSSRV